MGLGMDWERHPLAEPAVPDLHQGPAKGLGKATGTARVSAKAKALAKGSAKATAKELVMVWAMRPVRAPAMGSAVT